MQPEHSIRINPLTNNILFNARISKVPDKKINLLINPDGLHLDSLEHNRAYLLDIKYPKNAIVDDTRARVSYNGTNLSVRVPVLKYDGMEEDETKGYRGLVRRVPLEESDSSHQTDHASQLIVGDDDETSEEGGLKEPRKTVSSVRARDKILAKNTPVSEPYVARIPLKHRPSTKRPDLHPVIAFQKQEKYVTSQDELLRLARKVAHVEEAKYSARLEKKKKDEAMLTQHMEAREQRKAMKKSKSRLVVERAKARLAMGDKKTRSGKRALQRQSKV
ncbi:Hypothetical protein DHA2_6367 [Giardia duodenalis]|uniref:Uncharacterized protein n=1 Tax=Giardia intestinalis TaxID=5741 RepID=V6TBV7_GIAIN|nr:Hypothetical protein DHA2_6367 [Giardia intestinalis]